MNTITLHKQSPGDRQRAIAHISGLSQDRAWDVEIRQHRKRRSLDANKFYWARVHEIADHLGLLIEETHDVCRHACLGYVELEIAGDTVRILKHTRNLSVEEFADYVTRVEAWAAQELGMIFAEDVR